MPSTAQISKKMASLSRSTFSCTSMLWMAETPLLWCPKPHAVRKILSLQKQMKTLHLVLPLVPVLAHPQDRPLVHPPKAIEVHLQDFLIAELNEALSLNPNFAASPLWSDKLPFKKENDGLTPKVPWCFCQKKLLILT